ncbi:15540_t:CDS:2 [Gigaspora margarita]|uniref:15540_t:CDS:1 n=2 Tax=Gigaspora margarita TaxID=4874 RepID=A0ABN7UX64_GIGMA|nr:15540_t:CDS:2 [Gigaspora margarita]
MVRESIIAVLIFIYLGFFGECIAHRHMHSHGGPTIVDLPANTLQNKYQWRCLDTSTSPLHVKDCNNVPTQTKFVVEFLQQSYDDCRRPIRILGPEETILAWNMDDNTLLMNSTYNAKNTEWCYSESNFEDAVLVHPYGRPKDCLSAPIIDGDPVTVIPCLVPTVEQIQGITWTFLTTLPRKKHHSHRF